RKFYSFFFFSSRRRHTRFSRDWSSDVCSSDLLLQAAGGEEQARSKLSSLRLGARLVSRIAAPKDPTDSGSSRRRRSCERSGANEAHCRDLASESWRGASARRGSAAPRRF